MRRLLASLGCLIGGTALAIACDTHFSADSGVDASSPVDASSSTTDGSTAEPTLDASTPDGTSGEASVVLVDGAADALSLPGVCGADCHVIFVTSTTHNGDLGGVAGADQYCKSAAAASKSSDIAARASRFIAWISIADPGMTGRVPATGSYARTDNSVAIAASRTELLSGTIQNVIDHDENGSQIMTGNLQGASWTGTAGDGKASADNCSGWTSTNGAGDIGRATSTDATWTDYGASACSELKHLYCIDAF